LFEFSEFLSGPVSCIPLASEQMRIFMNWANHIFFITKKDRRNCR